jgi:hypothetical protein
VKSFTSKPTGDEIPVNQASPSAWWLEEFGAPVVQMESAQSLSLSPESGTVLCGAEAQARACENVFAEFARRLSRVAVSIGGDAAGAELNALLSSAPFAPQAQAWGSVLNGESDDLASCGPVMLDEFAAKALATALGQPERAQELRKNVRNEGIVAFGLLDAA